MKILILGWIDPAGVAGNQVNAINKYTEHRAMSITAIDNQGYEGSFINPSTAFIQEAIDNADVVHFNSVLKDAHIKGTEIKDDYSAFEKFYDFEKNKDGKHIVTEYHGSINLRDNPSYYTKRHYEVGDIIVSTPDLLQVCGCKTYMPNIVPIWKHSYLPNPKRDNKIPILIHAPTNREMKNTADLINSPPGMPQFNIQILSGMHNEVMEAKQCGDICFDQMQNMYGMNALEAMSMGIPALTGLDEFNVKTIMETLECSFTPFVRVDKETLHTAIAELVYNKEAREDIGRMSREWMEEYWNDRILVNRLINIYRGDY